MKLPFISQHKHVHAVWSVINTPTYAHVRSWRCTRPSSRSTITPVPGTARHPGADADRGGTRSGAIQSPAQASGCPEGERHHSSHRSRRSGAPLRPPAKTQPTASPAGPSRRTPRRRALVGLRPRSPRPRVSRRRLGPRPSDFAACPPTPARELSRTQHRHGRLRGALERFGDRPVGHVELRHRPRAPPAGPAGRQD